MSQLTWPDLAHRFPFRLAVIVEEIGKDFARAAAAAASLGLDAVEVGELWGEPIGIAGQDKLAHAKEVLEHYGLPVCAVSPTTFKSVLLGHVPPAYIDQEPHVQEELWLLERQLAAAQFLQAPYVRVFSGRREGMVGLGNPSPRLPKGGDFPEEMQEKVAALLRLACRRAEQAGIPLVLENVRSCWGNSGHHLALIAARVDSPWLRLIWDQSNGFVAGEDDAYPAGYAAVKPYMVHTQIKDAVVEDPVTGKTRWECIGAGEINLGAQLQALAADGYPGYVSIETHWSPPGGDPETNTRRTYAGLMKLLSTLAN